MVSVMNNDFDLERNPSSGPVAEEPRVSNDEKVDVGSEESDLNVKDETRVSTGDGMSSQKSAVEETRVSSGPRQEGDGARVLDVDSNNLVKGESECYGARVSSGNDGVRGDEEIELEVQDEVVIPEAAVIQYSNDGITGNDPLCSPSTSNLDVMDDDTTREEAYVDNNEGLVVDAANGDFRLEKLSISRASVAYDVGASSINNVIKAGQFKILGSCFEMGDMVWGKVKSHPWWPGHIFSEAFATSSVRRSRRDGHVLVAFFGDSSYGWFDLTELVPYEPHYTEKSQQTNSRNFMNAVEESVDEVSRRSALGLSCRCRNPANFRPANVPGYVEVDVVEYEPGAIYSVSQIQKARESFQPAETLSFIKQLAAVPRSDEGISLGFIKHKAIALAYRRSIFEEFDETYAEAFGQHSVRLSPTKGLADKEPSRAPFSGPLVMAEALGGRKSSYKGPKPKELSKKDRYLFKRRVEPGDLITTKIGHAHGSSSASSIYEDGTPDLAAGSFVFQKRDQVGSSDELVGAPLRHPVAASSQIFTTKDVPAAGLDVVIGPAVSGKRVSLGPASGPQQSESTQPRTMPAVGSIEHRQGPDSRIVGIGSDGVNLGTNSDLMKKKKKAKRPAGERSSEKPDIAGKKPKILRKLDSEKTIVHLETLSSGAGGFKLAGKPMQIGASSRERKDIEMIDAAQHVGSLASGAVEGNEVEVPQLLADLLGLALNPFHGVDRNRPVIVRQFFLKFRSLNFLKSSSASSPPESESNEVRAIRSPPASELTDRTPSESGKIVPSKHSKLLMRHDDPTKGGRKRIPSERQEENAAKRAKKITEVRTLAAEKKGMLKNSEMQHTDGKAKVAAVQQSPPSRLAKKEQHMKKTDRPPRVEEPTFLVMKFQSGSPLPSLMELKARFARFGPLDTSLSRVFYKTNTCRVAFLFKQDANVAYRYAVGSKALFSNVKFMLRPVASPESQQPSGVKTEDLHAESVAHQDPSTAEQRLPGSTVPPLAPQPVQLKSCLKRPLGSDEPAPPSNSSATVKTTRVRFNMGEDKGGAGAGASASASNRPGGQLQMTDSRNANLSSESGPPSSSSSVAMDTVIINQRFISSSHLPPILPTPLPLVARPPINHPHQHHVELPPRDNLNYNVIQPPVQAQPLPPSLPVIDISQQMMSLLTRCHEVVTNVKSILGHVPYQPL